MQRLLLKSKLHRVTVTHNELHYEGSCAIDEALLNASGILPNEKISIYNINNGLRFSTYAILADNNSGIISLNGAAARMAMKGDLIIIASYAIYDEEESRDHKPIVIYVDDKNKMLKKK